MHFSTILTTAALASLSLAADFSVKVSNAKGELSFTPNNTVAAAGDTVTFTFYPESHSVVQAAFAKPCSPKAGGFWSGFVPVASGVGTTKYQITVNDTKPIWFYCSRGDHCQSGMAGAINAPTTGNTTEAWIDASKKATSNVSPTEENGFGGMLMNGTSSTSGSMTMSMSTATATGASASAASATGTSAASAVQLSKGLGLAALLGFLVV